MTIGYWQIRQVREQDSPSFREVVMGDLIDSFASAKLLPAAREFNRSLGVDTPQVPRRDYELQVLYEKTLSSRKIRLPRTDVSGTATSGLLGRVLGVVIPKTALEEKIEFAAAGDSSIYALVDSALRNSGLGVLESYETNTATWNAVMFQPGMSSFEVKDLTKKIIAGIPSVQGTETSKLGAIEISGMRYYGPVARLHYTGPVTDILRLRSGVQAALCGVSKVDELKFHRN